MTPTADGPTGAAATIVGIDVGGTFTDLYYRDDAGAVHALKVPSTPDDPSRGLLDGLLSTGLGSAQLGTIVHGTTIATNAVIERRGARCALITTRGFRDVLELGRRDRMHVFGLSGVQQPLISRDRRFEVAERLDPDGRILVGLVDAEVSALAAELAASDVECIVVALIHAYANPVHEHRIRAILMDHRRDWHVVLATDVLREYYEFERTSTAVVQGYLQPLISRYASGLRDRLAASGIGRQVLVMQSNGGVTALEQLRSRAAHIVRSGPAAGVVAAARLARDAGFRKVITGDMGGTSFDVAVVIDGEPEVAAITQLDFRIPLKIPMIDVHTIGAGGGSIAHIDGGGVLQVGPRSAGAAPGPACYGQGGREPTVTDANVVLGRIDPARPIGGAGGRSLDRQAARAALETLGAPLGLTAEQAAEAVLAVVNQTMAGRIRLLSVERGHDPADFAFVAFGGAGPLHGAALLLDIGIRTMLVPSHPGVLCAMGCVLADLRYDYAQTLDRPLAELEMGELRRIAMRHAAQGREQLRASQVAIQAENVVHHAEMAYRGQLHTLKVTLDLDGSLADLEAAFVARYTREYGRALSRLPPVLVALRTTVTGVRPEQPAPLQAAHEDREAVPAHHRDVFFGRWLRCPIFDRAALLPGDRIAGPAIIEQADTTTVIEPMTRAIMDRLGNLLVDPCP